MKYPWVVALVDAIFLTRFCSGSLIASRYVLTAAHCVFSEEDNRQFKKKYYEIKVVTIGVVHLDVSDPSEELLAPALLCHNGIRAPIIGPFRAWKPPILIP